MQHSAAERGQKISEASAKCSNFGENPEIFAISLKKNIYQGQKKTQTRVVVSKAIISSVFQIASSSESLCSSSINEE